MLNVSLSPIATAQHWHHCHTEEVTAVDFHSTKELMWFVLWFLWWWVVTVVLVMHTHTSALMLVYLTITVFIFCGKRSELTSGYYLLCDWHAKSCGNAWNVKILSHLDNQRSYDLFKGTGAACWSGSSGWGWGGDSACSASFFHS